jgi:methionyl-tRNA formyltransferase
MKVGFAGTPAFAAGLLRALLDADIPVALSLTQPDRARGRGQRLAASPVKELAQERAIPVHQPTTLATADAAAPLLAEDLDVLVVAAYGLILPPVILAWPRHGCVNVHASLLPRWRGAAPIQRALLAGDEATGITLMQMDAGLDTGPMLDIVRIPIATRETAGTLEHKLAVAGASALVSCLHRMAVGTLGAPVPQPADGATYASKIQKTEADIDWSASAAIIDRQVRAFDPIPGAWAFWSGERVKVWRAQPATSPPRGHAPGSVLAVAAEGVTVACGEGAVVLEELQPAGGRRMSAFTFATGRKLAPGGRFNAASGA